MSRIARCGNEAGASSITRLAWVGAALSSGCIDPPLVATGSTSGAPPSSRGSGTASTSTAGRTDHDPATGVVNTTDEGGRVEDDGATFIIEPDFGGLCGGRSFQCDTWTQDCPAGEKCTPATCGGGDEYDHTRCVPIEGRGVAGSPCRVLPAPAIGQDTCAEGHLCWDVDSDTLEGVCIALCQGSEAEPVCAEGSNCTITQDALFTGCVPGCDPLAPDCEDGEACVYDDQRFSCVPVTAPPGEGIEGDSCTLPGDCQPGHHCTDASQMQGCEHSACCAPVCDLALRRDPCAPPTQCTYLRSPIELPVVGVCIDHGA